MKETKQMSRTASPRPARRLFLVAALAAVSATSVLGCELLVDFDRTRIPVDEGGVEPTPTPTADAADEAAAEEAGPAEAGPDGADAQTSDAADASDAGDASDAADDADADDGAPPV